MNAMREAWTDERLDDFARKVEVGFAEIRDELRALNARLDTRFNAMEARADTRFNAMEARADARFDAMEARADARFNAMEARLNSMDARSDALQRMVVQVGAGLIGTMLFGFASLIVSHF